MSDSKKAYEEKFVFWEEQEIKPVKKVHMTPRVATYIINRALLEVKDVELGEDLEALKEWINQKPQI